ncbi:amino acid decarboxylase [Kitasatospora indigofera]|uniref:Amino acid decarboxylase n=1 Tax=Kitasatospora indigofera TaxID=67307 RepID=A0A919FDZ4_9ACTN|nr:pyridoxal-dependent decarboxylase [Kitasatospora indigofera]GHH62901.1 amino acid decarboxylase [Kitasatospora indigofera]
MTGGRPAAGRRPGLGLAGTGGTGGARGAEAGGGPAGPGPAALSGGLDGPQALRPLLDTVLDALAAGAARRAGPVPAGRPGPLAEQVTAEFARPATGPDALRRLTELLAHGSADPADPACAAHLHCPPLAVAVAADLAVSALNPSQDSWDQAPAATALETALLAELAGLVGFDPRRATGVLTSGGTESNLMGLMLARDQILDGIVEVDGLPAGGRPLVFASQAAHFSVQRAAALLGLGERAVVAVPVDRELRMDPDGLARAMAQAVWEGGTPLAVVATAGTTDTGAVDPLHRAADLAARYGAWLHVDAAYGGGALLSDRLAPLLDGIARADSVSLDWHKLGWQPAAAGVFLARRAETYVSLLRRAVYLNPADDEEAGYPSLLGLSLRTTRRADAFKLAVTLRALGRAGLGALVDACHDLALATAEAVRAEPALDLHCTPVLSTVVFRYLPAEAAGAETGEGRAAAGRTDPDRLGAEADRVNAEVRRLLLREGRAVVGRTELPGSGPGRVRLKLTLLNPHTTAGQTAALLDEVVRAGREVERTGF